MSKIQMQFDQLKQHRDAFEDAQSDMVQEGVLGEDQDLRSILAAIRPFYWSSYQVYDRHQQSYRHGQYRAEASNYAEAVGLTQLAIADAFPEDRFDGPSIKTDPNVSYMIPSEV